MNWDFGYYYGDAASSLRARLLREKLARRKAEKWEAMKRATRRKHESPHHELGAGGSDD